MVWRPCRPVWRAMAAAGGQWVDPPLGLVSATAQRGVACGGGGFGRATDPAGADRARGANSGQDRLRALRPPGGARQGSNPGKPGRPTHHPLQAALGSGYGVNLWDWRGDTHSAHPCIGFYEQRRLGWPESLRIPWVLADSGLGKKGFCSIGRPTIKVPVWRCG